MRSAGHRAEPPRPPALSEREQRRERARAETLKGRVRLEQRSLVRGLILLAVVILIASLVGMVALAVRRRRPLAP